VDEKTSPRAEQKNDSGPPVRGDAAAHERETPAGGVRVVAPSSEPALGDSGPPSARTTTKAFGTPAEPPGATPSHGIAAIMPSHRLVELADDKPMEMLKEVARLRRDLAKVHQELAHLTAERARDEERYDEAYARAEEADLLDAQLQEREREHAELEKSLEQWKVQLTKVEREFVSTRADLEMARAEIAAARKDLELARKEAQDKRDVIDKKSELENENEALSRRIWDLEGENGTMRAKLNEVKTANEGLHARVADLEDKLADAEERARRGPPDLRSQLGKSVEALAKIIDLAREATPPPPPVAPRASVLPAPTPPPRPSGAPARSASPPAPEEAISSVEADPFPSSQAPIVAAKPDD
jgi:predicted  nucleic acid-binding Zn-ribbon protein